MKRPYLSPAMQRALLDMAQRGCVILENGPGSVDWVYHWQNPTGSHHRPVPAVTPPSYRTLLALHDRLLAFPMHPNNQRQFIGLHDKADRARYSWWTLDRGEWVA